MRSRGGDDVLLIFNVKVDHLGDIFVHLFDKGLLLTFESHDDVALSVGQKWKGFLIIRQAHFWVTHEYKGGGRAS